MPIRPPALGIRRAARRERRDWGRLLVWAGLAGVGAVVGVSLLNLVWPRPDPRGTSTEAESIRDLANVPSRPVTLLVIGVDADQLGAGSNGAAPAGPANADALLLLRVNPDGPLQVLPLPASLAVQLPGEQRPRSLASVYRAGGPALTADAVRELVDLPAGRPDRYLVLSRGALRALVSGFGTVEANPQRSMRHTDKAQDLTIDLQAGVQRLGPEQIEHLARWRDPARPLESRLENHQQVVTSLQREMSLQGMRVDLPALVDRLKGQVSTNLTRGEVLSLMAAALRPETTVSFTTLPLAAPRQSQAAKATGLRELAASLPQPFWPEPQAGSQTQSGGTAAAGSNGS
jgi:anionic cell wall polymer biosynthesis LytR-Cps2A-Psr (LCP) family protein